MHKYGWGSRQVTRWKNWCIEPLVRVETHVSASSGSISSLPQCNTLQHIATYCITLQRLEVCSRITSLVLSGTNEGLTDRQSLRAQLKIFSHPCPINDLWPSRTHVSFNLGNGRLFASEQGRHCIAISGLCRHTNLIPRDLRQIKNEWTGQTDVRGIHINMIPTSQIDRVCQHTLARTSFVLCLSHDSSSSRSSPRHHSSFHELVFA